jgi:peptidyl-prolyl cis-trans isomerase SurA
MKKLSLFIGLFLFFTGSISAQKVTNVSNHQEQSTIIVSYDLETKTPCKISLFVSTNGGTTWQGPLKKVTGDVGVNVGSGNKNITWNVLEEFEELRGDKIKFQVRVEEINNILKQNKKDTDINKSLVKKIYDRSLKEIKASHILLLVDENASPADTLVAYNKAKKIRERALNGENFGQLAVEFSQDPSVKENKGNLGYFSTFRMVYAFESAAYNTPKGGISFPVRSRFGYHLIKVEDIRNNRGELIVAHIMILNPKVETPLEEAATKSKIDDIYQKLMYGEKFEELAKQFSEDKSSSSSGGILTRFGSGQLSTEEFENAAFSLTPENPISVPIHSRFGWHIIKLIEKYPPKSIEQIKQELELNINIDRR